MHSRSTPPRDVRHPAVSIEDLCEAEQDAAFDGMVRAYQEPSQDVVNRYAEIGRELDHALKRVEARRAKPHKAKRDP